MYRGDNSIESANTPIRDSYSDERDYAVYRAVVIKRKYVDDIQNLSKGSVNPTMMYDVQILGGYKEGTIIPNCRVVTPLGGRFNFSETILKPATKPLSKTGLHKTDGEIVYVAYVGGDPVAPIILGGGNHPLDEDKTGAKKADGPRYRHQFNGILTEIDKDGKYTLTRLGGTYNETTGEFEPDADGKAVVVKYHANRILRSVKSETVVDVLEGADETATRYFATGLQVKEDGKNDKTTTTTKGGLVVTTDGQNDKWEVTTAGGAKITVDGKSGKVDIDSSGANISIDKSGNIKLNGDFVDLGSAASDFVPLFLELATAFAQHTHSFTDITPGGPVPSVTGPPTAPLLSTVGSSSVKVQS